jgi:transcriptional accessory protein Tex/SPT6
MDVDVKRQRISLTMRLDDTPGTSSPSDSARANVDAGATSGPRDRRTAGREQPASNVFAIALERAKEKK